MIPNSYFIGIKIVIYLSLGIYILTLNKNLSVGRILLENIEIYAYHGHFAEEQQTGGTFIINLEIDADIEKACSTDQLDDTFDYQRAYQIVQEQMQIRSSLLEHIAGRILDQLLISSEKIKSVKISVSKMNPPFGGNVKAVSVELFKSRK